MMKEEIKQIIENHQTVIASLLSDETVLEKVKSAAELIVATYQAKRKVLFCGNGGSAADARHLAAELSGRFYINREPLFAEALHVNSSYITAVANDFGFEDIYARILEAKGNKGDVLVAMSTSGQSKNILKALKVADVNGIEVIAMTGAKDNPMLASSRIAIQIPSTDTPRIQEGHMLLGHIICQLVEAKLFPV